MNSIIFTISYLLAAALVCLKIKREIKRCDKDDFLEGESKEVVNCALFLASALWPLCVGFVCISHIVDFTKSISRKFRG